MTTDPQTIYVPRDCSDETIKNIIISLYRAQQQEDRY